MIEAFKNPQLSRPTAIRLEGNVVYGHAAEWNTNHLALPGVKPPRGTDYRYFHLGGYEWKGDQIDVGSITLHTTHAPLMINGLPVGGQAAIEHYEHTGTVAAYVRCGEDTHGIWFCGMLAKGVDGEDREALLGAKVSGDWRAYNGRRELIGMLAVNTPGFAIPRERALIAAGHAEGLALVASGVVERDSADERLACARGSLSLRMARARLRDRLAA